MEYYYLIIPKKTILFLLSPILLIFSSSIASAQPKQPKPATGLRYNDIQQKSIHNVYTMAESVIDQLVYYNIRNMEIDLRAQPVENIYGPRLQDNDWYMYHSVHESRRCQKLSDFLRLIRAFHDAVPQHEVITLTMEFKGADACVNDKPVFDETAGENPALQTPAGLDARLRLQLGNALFTPADLLASCPGAKNLQEAVAKCGWPTLKSLQGKVIINVLAYNEERCYQYLGRFKAYTEDALSKQYTPSNNVAEKRVAFAAPLDLWWKDFSEWDKKPWVVVHTEVSDLARAQAIRRSPKFGAHIMRSGDGKCTNATGFQAQQQYFNLILTDYINFHPRPWSRTHNQYGYPFAPIGEVGNACWNGNHATSQLKETMNRLEIEVASDDIDHGRDNFAFRYDSVQNQNVVWTSLISSASNKDIHGWAKGCIMVRENLSESSPYYAIGIGGDNHEMFIQFRTPGCDGPCGTDHTEAAPSLRNGCDPEDAHFVKLELTPLAGGGVRVQGYGSFDGISWQAFRSVDFPRHLALQGLAASSNETGVRNPDGSLTKFVFVNVRMNRVLQRHTTLKNFAKIGNTPHANFSDRSFLPMSHDGGPIKPF